MLEMLANFDSLVNSMIFPSKQEYSIEDLGPRDRCINKKIVHRKDFTIRNKRGLDLECSHFAPLEMKTQLPCVIYLHGNGCSRLEALPYVDLICRNDMTLFCFDFSGSGLSQGSVTSIGFFEQEDVECVIDHLTKTGKTNRMALWGRSMGAVTSLLFAAKDTRLSCIIADSSFTSFKQVVQEYTKKNAALPSFLSFAAFGALRNTINKKGGFNIELLEPIGGIDKISVPILFGAATSDELILPSHSKQLEKAYKGTKQIIIFEGEHNSLRPVTFVLSAIDFLKQHNAGVNEVLPEELQIQSPTTIIRTEPKRSSLKFGQMSFDEKRSSKLKMRPQDELKKIVLTQHRASVGARTMEKFELQSPLSAKPKFQLSWTEQSNSTQAPCLSLGNSPLLDERKKHTPKPSNHNKISLGQIIPRDTTNVADENSPSLPNKSAEIKFTSHRNSYLESTGPRTRELTENVMATEPNIRKALIYSPKTQSESVESVESNKLNQTIGGDGRRPQGLAILKINLNTPQNINVVKDLDGTDELSNEDQAKNSIGSDRVMTPRRHPSQNTQSQSFSATLTSRSSLPRSSTQHFPTHSQTPTHQMSRFSVISRDSQSKEPESPVSDFPGNSSPSAGNRTTQRHNSLLPQCSSPYVKKTHTTNESIFAKASVLKNSTEISELQKNTEEEQPQTCSTIPSQNTLSFTSRAMEVSSIRNENSPTSKYQGYYTPKAMSCISSQTKNSEKLESLVKPYQFSDYTERILDSRKYQNKSMGVYLDESPCNKGQQETPINEEQNLCE